MSAVIKLTYLRCIKLRSWDLLFVYTERNGKGVNEINWWDVGEEVPP